MEDLFIKQNKTSNLENLSYVTQKINKEFEKETTKKHYGFRLLKN